VIGAGAGGEGSALPPLYTITWKDWDGTIINVTGVYEGGVPWYPPYGNPAREEDERYTYSFAGWTPDFTVVTCDAEYTALYTSVPRDYRIDWMNGETRLASDALEYGAVPVYSGETPGKESDWQYTYAFIDWEPEIAPVENDAVYTAVFAQIPRKYTVTWLGFDGNPLETDTDVAPGTMAEYNGPTPARDDANYTYTFTGWQPEPGEVKSDAFYWPEFTITPKSGIFITPAGYGRLDIRNSVTGALWDGETIALYKKGTPGSISLYAYAGADGFSNVKWLVDGVEVESVYGGLTIYASNYGEYKHSITFIGEKDGVPYAQVIPFTVSAAGAE